MDTEFTQVSLRSAVPRAHSRSGRASPRSSSWVGHSASPGMTSRMPPRSAAVQAAIHQAWQHLQEEKLQADYAAAVAENPHYPYESAEEAAALRASRRARQSRDSAA
jgi:hypothetical protein